MNNGNNDLNFNPAADQDANAGANGVNAQWNAVIAPPAAAPIVLNPIFFGAPFAAPGVANGNAAIKLAGPAIDLGGAPYGANAQILFGANGQQTHSLIGNRTLDSNNSINVADSHNVIIKGDIINIGNPPGNINVGSGATLTAGNILIEQGAEFGPNLNMSSKSVLILSQGKKAEINDLTIEEGVYIELKPEASLKFKFNGMVTELMAQEDNGIILPIHELLVEFPDRLTALTEEELNNLNATSHIITSYRQYEDVINALKHCYTEDTNNNLTKLDALKNKYYMEWDLICKKTKGAFGMLGDAAGHIFSFLNLKDVDISTPPVDVAEIDNVTPIGQVFELPLEGTE